MQRNRAILALAAALSLAPATQAQRPRAVNGGGGKNVERTTQVINDCERRTGAFEKKIKRALNHSAINHTAREDQLNRDADRLENAMDKVGDSWNRDHNVQKTRQYVSGAIAVARDINKTMVGWHLDADAEQEWVAVRGELNRLAETFGLPRVAW